MRSSAARTGLLVVGALVALLLVGGVWLMVRPPVSETSSVNPQILIQCAAATGVSADACGTWGDEILADDPAPHTFERKDLRRVALDRSLFGFGDACTVAWFIERDPADPVWSGSVPCR